MTDICVLHTAIDAYNLGYHTRLLSLQLPLSGPENHQFALGHLEHSETVAENLAEIQNIPWKMKKIWKSVDKDFESWYTEQVIDADGGLAD